jgi:tetratricopeptide (TPR) repeat protein
MIEVRSNSLEAVTAYSEGAWLNNHGKPDEAVAPLQRAIDIDPQFGAAYLMLAAVYNNLGQHDRAEQAAIATHKLRGQLNERQRITEEVYYSKLHNGDYPAMLRALEAGTAIYPTEWSFWSNLANAQLNLANYDLAEAAAERAVALKPPSELPYLALSAVEIERGDLAAARKACELAISRGFAGAMIHASLLDQAILARDERGVREQRAWAAKQPDASVMLSIEAYLAYRAGRFRDGDAIFQRLATLDGSTPQTDPNLGFRARLLAEVGLDDRARALLAQAKGQDERADFIIALAQAGDPARAERLVRENVAKFPDDTMNRIDLAPKARASMAIRAGDPKAALAALEPAMPYQARGFDISYLLGRAYFLQGDGRRAAAEFQVILDHPGRYPESPHYSLAQVWLARSLLLQGKLPQARQAYRQFFADWRNADPDLPLLKQARAEYADGKLSKT